MAQPSETDQCPTWLQHKLPKLHSADYLDLCKISHNKVLLIVNTASSCHFTPQFKQLENLYQRYKDQGLMIIGFPSDSFFQEHDNAKKTAKVCYINYGVSFPIVASSPVRGKKANAVFHYLGEKSTYPKWNFYKYLINKQGLIHDYYISTTAPEGGKLEADIIQLLSPALLNKQAKNL